jgi:hypothetical protein
VCPDGPAKRVVLIMLHWSSSSLCLTQVTSNVKHQRMSDFGLPDHLGPALLAVVGLTGTVFIGVVTNALWEWIRDTFSYNSSNFIDMRGTWRIEITIQNAENQTETYEELLKVEQQFSRRFRGTIVTPHPTRTGEKITLKIVAEFRDKFHAIFSYESSDQRVTDIGAGLIQVRSDHLIFDAGSTNFGVSSPTYPTSLTSVGRKVLAH